MTEKYRNGDILKEVLVQDNPNTYIQNTKSVTEKRLYNIQNIPVDEDQLRYDRRNIYG